MDDVQRLLMRAGSGFQKEAQISDAKPRNSSPIPENRASPRPIAATPRRSALNDVLRKHDMAARSRPQRKPF